MYELSYGYAIAEAMHFLEDDFEVDMSYFKENLTDIFEIVEGDLEEITCDWIIRDYILYFALVDQPLDKCVHNFKYVAQDTDDWHKFYEHVMDYKGIGVDEVMELCSMYR